jgi:hypothetical protein
MIRPVQFCFLAIALTFFPKIASARQVRFIGGHPVASKYGGGYCYIEVPHMHAYAPDHANLYQLVGDHHVFTGDPSPFGYEGEKHTFYGHHPVVTVGAEPVFCYIDGPHSHPFAPPQTPEYKLKGHVAFYVGPFPPSYVKLRPHRVRVVNAEYRPYVALRPRVEVEPPKEWRGEVWVAPPVSPPSVSVTAPRISGPGVVIAPPPPHAVTVSAPGVRLAPPVPPAVAVSAPGVVVAPPAGVVVVEDRRGHHGHHDEGWHHGHDRGKHKGWYKHHD